MFNRYQPDEDPQFSLTAPTEEVLLGDELPSAPTQDVDDDGHFDEESTDDRVEPVADLVRSLSPLRVLKLHYWAAACGYAAAGLLVGRIRRDGSKQLRGPAMDLSDLDQLSAALEWKRSGIGIYTGELSAGLEVLDFAAAAENVFLRWGASIKHLLVDLPIVRTPGGGYHIYYRCNEVSPSYIVDGSDNFETADVKLIGEGGYVIAPFSPRCCHHTGLPYRQIAGWPLPNIPRISIEVRRQILDSAEAAVAA